MLDCEESNSARGLSGTGVGKGKDAEMSSDWVGWKKEAMTAEIVYPGLLSRHRRHAGQSHRRPSRNTS